MKKVYPVYQKNGRVSVPFVLFLMNFFITVTSKHLVINIGIFYTQKRKNLFSSFLIPVQVFLLSFFFTGSVFLLFTLTMREPQIVRGVDWSTVLEERSVYTDLVSVGVGTGDPVG